jgi:hypothetical protein
MEGAMSVIDSHHHFWWLDKHTYKWPEAAGDRLDRDFTPGLLWTEMEACGIGGSVLIQVLHELGETGEYLDLQQRNAFVRGVVGWVPLADPPAAAQALEQLPERGRLVGIRHLISNEPNPEWLLQDAVQESLQLLARAGLVFDAIPLNERQLDAVITTARRLPDLQIVINHLGAAAGAGRGLGAVGVADHARSPLSERHLEALGRTRHRDAVDVVDGAASPLRRPRARRVRPHPHHGGEQLAGDPARRQLPGDLARHRRARRQAQRHREGSGARRHGGARLSLVISP